VIFNFTYNNRFFTDKGFGINNSGFNFPPILIENGIIMSAERNHVCPVERAGALDNRFRKLVQNPRKILAPFVTEGMKVLDVGCGPGFFSIEMSKMVGSNGKVFAVDLQEAMLEKIKAKIQGTELENRIALIKCEQDKMNIPENVDFILAFYMVHEVPDKTAFFKTLINALDEKGRFLIIEPKFHVSEKAFIETMLKAKLAGFKITPAPKYFLSYSAILTKNNII